MENSKLIEYPGSLSNLIYDAIIWLGNTSNILWGLLAISFTLFLLYLTFYRSNSKNTIGSSFFFLFVLSLGILFLRLPAICAFELSVDESQWITGAATLLSDGRFWLSVNGMTSGPLNIYPLCLIKIFGFSLNYSTLRLFILLFCVLPTIILTFKSFKIISGERITRIISVLLFVFFSISEHADILAYNSEHIPMLLMASAFYLFVKAQHKSPASPDTSISLLYLFSCGLIVGLMPYSKLQISPVAFSFFIGVIIINILSKEKSLFKNITFATAVILPSLFLLSYLLLFNLTTEFWNYFVLNNFEYSNRGLYTSSATWLMTQKNELAVSWYQKLFVVPRLILMSKDTALFFGSLILISVFSLSILIYKLKYVTSKNRIGILFLLAIILSVCFAVIRPGNFFLHYIILLVIPAAYLTGYSLGVVLETFPQYANKIFTYAKYCMAVIVIVPVIVFSIDGNCYIRDYLISNSPGKISNISTLLRKYSKPGDKLAVWGYLNSIYVESQLIQGTREPNSYLQITESPLRNYFTVKYCEDIITNKPKLFVDVVGKSSFFYSDYTQRYENYPAIKELINNNYELKDTIDDVRIFVLKNR